MFIFERESERAGRGGERETDRRSEVSVLTAVSLMWVLNSQLEVMTRAEVGRSID